MNKPHIRKCESSYNGELWHCSYRHDTHSIGAYWHTYGATWQVAYDKMVALSHRQIGANYEPLTARLDL